MGVPDPNRRLMGQPEQLCVLARLGTGFDATQQDEGTHNHQPDDGLGFEQAKQQS
jgi:hypothetical protein